MTDDGGRLPAHGGPASDAAHSARSPEQSRRLPAQ
ncbi:hypothetical protein JOE68_005471 [Saccharothrix algeriensis]|uniref:Uncharacterized protein n=1 Tax=Saccharothrix algeriensis TaxID=173560 RepID=A0ABS2SEC3_9PSEU|nr:hypothetical protein [Saccharothrix algeriensis]